MGARNTANVLQGKSDSLSSCVETYFRSSEENIIIFHFPWKNSNLSFFANVIGISYMFSVFKSLCSF